MLTPHEALPTVAGFVLACWAVAAVGFLPAVAKRTRLPLGLAFTMLGWLLLVGYLGWLWLALGRPPMRTQGETRLWYTVLLPAVGLFAHATRGLFRVPAAPMLLLGMAGGFLLKTALHPELFDATLPPALQSPWFVPHVLVYMLSYACFGLAAALAAWALVRGSTRGDRGTYQRAAEEGRRLVDLGFPLLTAGMIFGAWWAKAAWGHYWSWDPKESWAFLTWAVYLGYLHLVRRTRLPATAQLALLAGGFLVVLGCWFGVNALPTARESLHSYME